MLTLVNNGGIGTKKKKTDVGLLDYFVSSRYKSSYKVSNTTTIIHLLLIILFLYIPTFPSMSAKNPQCECIGGLPFQNSSKRLSIIYRMLDLCTAGL